MYFQASLAIDPSQMTKIQKVKPSQTFKQLLFYLSGGVVSHEEETETFSAVSILQQIHSAFQQLQINNIVRLAKNGLDFYFDKHGNEDDFEKAIDQFQFDVEPKDSAGFETLFLVLEHRQGFFHYLFEIQIHRVHLVGKYPIEINIFGLLEEWTLLGKKKKRGRPKKEETDLSPIFPELFNIFENQGTYDDYLSHRESEFYRFSRDVAYAIRDRIGVDDVKMTHKDKIIRPSKRYIKTYEIFPAERAGDAIFAGYYGFPEALFYAFHWGKLCSNRNIYCTNFYLVTDQGEELLYVGEPGFDAGEAPTLDPELPFKLPPAEELRILQPDLVEILLKEENAQGV